MFWKCGLESDDDQEYLMLQRAAVVMHVVMHSMHLILIEPKPSSAPSTKWQSRQLGISTNNAQEIYIFPKFAQNASKSCKKSPSSFVIVIVESGMRHLRG